MSAKLYLIPTPLGDTEHAWLPESERLSILHIQHFVVEAQKTARKHLKALGVTTPIRELNLQDLNEHTPDQELMQLLEPIRQGFDLGLVSEAGCPAVADPGAKLVALAHKLDIEVVPLTGPSSILLALMGSGANGQNFAFKGYLPVETQARKDAIKLLEKRSFEQDETQLFIETPYRNDALLESLKQTLRADTRLCVAVDLHLPSQQIISKPVKDWKHVSLSLHKRLAIFVLYAR